MGHFIEQQASKFEGVEDVCVEKGCSDIDMGSEPKFGYVGMKMVKNGEIVGTSAGFEHKESRETVERDGLAVHLGVNS